VAVVAEKCQIVQLVLVPGASLGKVSYFDGSMGLFRRPETSRKKMRIKGGGTTGHFSGGLSNVVVRVLPSRE
jgi:hypothetical protein